MRSILAVKLRRDLRASWPRFALMVLAITVSLMVFGAILITWATASRETGNAYLSTEPASATIVLEKGISPERMAALTAEVRKRPQVIEATGRTQFDTSVQVNGARRDAQLQTFVAAPDDPMDIVKFDLKRNGSWPPAAGEIYLGDDDSLDLLDAAVGDSITVETPDNGPIQLKIAGTVYDPSLAPSPQEQRGHAYLSSESLAATGKPVLLNQLKLQIADPGKTEPSRNRKEIVAVSDNVAAWLQDNYGLTIAEVQVPKPYEHPHQWQTNVLLASLLTGGAAALTLSTVLVATMLNNLFTQQTAQIGIMKAIGARSSRIGGMYLAMTLVVAAAATLIALPPAIWYGQKLVARLLGTLGIQPSSLTAPWWAYAVIVVVGLGLAPLMSLIPLLKASRITVRAAIDHHGGSAKPSKATGLLARLSRLRRFNRGLLMALRNTVRRPARFWLSVGLLATAGTVFVAAMSLGTSTQAAEDAKEAQRYWDVEVQLSNAEQQDDVAKVVAQLPGVQRVEAWTQSEIGLAQAGEFPVTRTYPDQGHGSISVNTVPQSSRRPAPEMVEGRWLNPGEIGAVVLNERTRDSTVPGLGAGDEVRMFIEGKPTSWRIVGIVKEGDSSNGGAYTTAEGLATATGEPPSVNRLRLITDDHSEEARTATANAADNALVRAGIEVDSAASVSRQIAASAGHMAPVMAVLIGVAVPLGVIGAVGLASTMSANVLDRIREFGVMHAIGARPKTVRRIVVAEGIFLTLTSCFIAVLPTLVLTRALGIGLGNLFGNTELPFQISALGVAIWVGLIVLGGILATEAAASRASRITVREAFTHL